MTIDLAELKRKIVFRFILAFTVIAIMLFLPAGTLLYWEAWVYCAVLFVPMLFVLSYFLRKDPGFLERRMRLHEKEKRQEIIIIIADFFFFIGFFVPGLDHRYGWSDVPAAVVIAADVVVLSGYILVFAVFRENSYASRIIEVEAGQTVVTTGPYAIVRHPMYLGEILMFVFTPLALGSYWALVFFVPLVPMIVLRLLNEEDMLKRELPGYKEYCQRTRYRLVPYLW
ncbi:MAG TPA: isoprenylcysteine carboxylmethyltransferase family protein [Candidatus Methanoperedenaceae archaeon]|nr:isoprenylcysteine carboxylmethyltransferase family protein [Candidatus Methanoperedenaceae archaeon]